MKQTGQRILLAAGVVMGLSSLSFAGSRKVEMCHVPPGNPDKRHTIRIGDKAIDAHLDHGDYFGKCRAVRRRARGVDDDVRERDDHEWYRDANERRKRLEERSRELAKLREERDRELDKAEDEAGRKRSRAARRTLA